VINIYCITNTVFFSVYSLFAELAAIKCTKISLLLLFYFVIESTIKVNGKSSVFSMT